MAETVTHIERIEVEPGVRLAVDVPPPSDRPVVLLSHSVGASMGMWDELVARLSDRCRVVRYDTRGHGRSDVSPGPYTIDRLGKDAIAILDALDISRAAFCGLSLGGLTGMWLGVNHGERLAGLILANTAANFPPAVMWAQRAAQVRADGMAPLVTPTLERWFTKAYRASHPDRVAAVGTMIAATSAEGYAGCCEVLAATDLKPRLSQISCPVHVICGAHDPSTTPARGEEIVAAIPGATIATLDAAHISAIEAPDAFAGEVEQFMSRVAGAVTS